MITNSAPFHSQRCSSLDDRVYGPQSLEEGLLAALPMRDLCLLPSSRQAGAGPGAGENHRTLCKGSFLQGYVARCLEEPRLVACIWGGASVRTCYLQTSMEDPQKEGHDKGGAS